MTWQDGYDEQDGRRASSGLDHELREAIGSVSSAQFDYDALIAGTMARASRIRRRRSVAQGVSAAVLVPTLVAAGWMIGNNLDGTRTANVDVAGSTQTAPATADDATTATTDAAVQTVPGRPPYQATEPPVPVSPDTEEAAYPNREPIPDARPTGIPFLDALTSQNVMNYPRVTPLEGYVGQLEIGDGTVPTGIEAHSGTSWMYYDGTNDLDQETVTITITAWDDSAGALRAIRTDEPTDFSWIWLGSGPTEEDQFERSTPAALPWPGHLDDEDYLLVETPQPFPDAPQLHRSGALVRQGDYLVGVTVTARTADRGVSAAAEIAERTAANLAYLDSAAGSD